MKAFSLLAIVALTSGTVQAQNSNTETGTVELPTSIYSTLIPISSSGSGPYACTTATTTSSTPVTLSPPASLTSSRMPSDGSTFISVPSTVPETTTTEGGGSTTASGTTTASGGTTTTSGGATTSGTSTTRSSTSSSASPSTTDGGDNDAAVGLQGSMGWAWLVVPALFVLEN